MPAHIRQYEVLKPLGAGHFGRVDLCFGETPARGAQPAKPRLVAVKSLKNAADQDSVRLLLQEFALLEQVKHRSVVRVFEYLDDERAVVMEYVHGTTLRDVLDACAEKREQVFSEAAVEIGCELADALYQAWTSPADNGEPLRLVHRDLKPENVMLTPSGEVKILDFGLARVENADFARDDRSRIRGTPIYMAPEQARGEDIDHRTDLFALGLILYELLMGRPAYRVPDDGPDPIAATYAAIEAGQLAEPCRELEAKLPGLGGIVTRLLQARPRNRYQTGHDLLVDLRRQLYRDRGAYLQEFCSFFFGRVRPLPEAPDPRNPLKANSMSNPPRKSIEERLKESLEKEAEPVGKAPVPVRRVTRMPEPEPDLPPVTPPAAAAPRVTPKIVPRSVSAAARPDDDDIVPPSVKGKPAAAPRKPAGPRSADETGMLPMVPLSDNADEREVKGDHSATAFFAIPAPKADRARPATPPAAAPPPMTPPQAGPRPFTPPVVQGPVAAAPAAPSPGIQGPTVGYGAAQTPFQVAGPPPTTPANAESRVQSWRVYAILVAVMGLAAVFLVSVVAVGWWKISQIEDKPKETVAVAAPPPPPPKHRQEDTAAPRPQQQAPAKAPTARPKPASSGGGGAPAAPAAPKSDKGTVSITFTSSPPPMQVEIRCGDFAARGSVSGGSVSIPNVPTGADCKMFPKGGVTATAFPVKGGGHYSCAITGTTTSCH